MFNEDEYKNNEINKYLAQQEGYEEVSDCCGAEVEYNEDNESYICSNCGSECNIQSLSDFQHDEYENAMEDKADIQRDNERDFCD